MLPRRLLNLMILKSSFWLTERGVQVPHGSQIHLRAGQERLDADVHGQPALDPGHDGCDLRRARRPCRHRLISSQILSRSAFSLERTMRPSASSDSSIRTSTSSPTLMRIFPDSSMNSHVSTRPSDLNPMSTCTWSSSIESTRPLTTSPSVILLTLSANRSANDAPWETISSLKLKSLLGGRALWRSLDFRVLAPGSGVH